MERIIVINSLDCYITDYIICNSKPTIGGTHSLRFTIHVFSIKTNLPDSISNTLVVRSIGLNDL